MPRNTLPEAWKNTKIESAENTGCGLLARGYLVPIDLRSGDSDREETVLDRPDVQGAREGRPQRRPVLFGILLIPAGDHAAAQGPCGVEVGAQAGSSLSSGIPPRQQSGHGGSTDRTETPQINAAPRPAHRETDAREESGKAGGWQ